LSTRLDHRLAAGENDGSFSREHSLDRRRGALNVNEVDVQAFAIEIAAP
jgi:hypothetical protein